LSDPLRRGLRTLIQTSFAGVIIIMLAAFGVIQWNETQTASVMAVLTPVISFMQNLLEDRPVLGMQLPALLKAPASSGVDPVPDV
jgi:hypothetical protein